MKAIGYKTAGSIDAANALEAQTGAEKKNKKIEK